MIAIAIVVVLRVILFTMQWFASVVMFSVTADKLRGFSEEDKLAVPGLSTNCAMGPTSTCTAAIVIGAVLWVVFSILVFVSCLLLSSLNSTSNLHLVETIFFIGFAIAWLIVALIVQSSATLDARKFLPSVDTAFGTVQAASWICLGCSCASGLLAYLVYGLRRVLEEDEESGYATY